MINILKPLELCNEMDPDIVRATECLCGCGPGESGGSITVDDHSID